MIMIMISIVIMIMIVMIIIIKQIVHQVKLLMFLFERASSSILSIEEFKADKQFQLQF